MHRRLKVREASRGKFVHLFCIEAVTHSYLKCSRDHRHVLATKMVVRRDLVSIQHLHSNSRQRQHPEWFYSKAGGRLFYSKFAVVRGPSLWPQSLCRLLFVIQNCFFSNQDAL